MNRSVLLALFLLACGGSDDERDCEYVPVVRGEAKGTILVTADAKSASYGAALEVETDVAGRFHLEFAAGEIVFAKPAATGTHDLSTLDAQLCSHDGDCVALEGSIVADSVDPTMFEATLRVDGQAEDRGIVVAAGESRVVYERRDGWQCDDTEKQSRSGCNGRAGGGSVLR